MPTIKISQLTEKPTMAGTEEVLINDSGVSKKFSTQRFLDVKTETETARDAALTAQTAAETAETNAETAETNASGSATAAATSETNAATSETNAANSATTAGTHATNAGTSETNAATSATNASDSETNASTSETNAASSATSASGSATTATTQAGNASTSATNAATSESNANGSATAAAGSASTATTQATNAASSASAASTSASNASTSATSASGSATAAAASAAAAASTYDSFDDRYLGVKASDPTTDNDGDALVQGMLYFDSVNSLMKVYDGSGWITTSSATLATLDVYKFTATASQTVFTGTDDDSNTLAIKPTAEMVTLNGIVLESGTDYTVTTSTLTLTAGAALDDEVNVYAFGNFELADHYNKAASDARYEPIDSAYTKSEADARYLQSIASNSIGADELNVSGNGTAGQYLGSDGDGTMTWTSISSDPTMGGDLSGTASNAQIVANAVGTTEIANSAVTDAKIAGMSSSKLSGALPAIDGSALTGVQPFPSGTKMVFAQASAPTGWTQDTANNDKALRVVSGSGGGTGGTHGLSSPPSTSHTHTGPSHTHSTPSHSHSHTLSAGAHTLSTTQMPSHSHSSYYWSGTSWNTTGCAKPQSTQSYSSANCGVGTSSTGGGSSHSHSLSGSITSGGSGTSGSGGTGATSSAGPTAFAPQYVDVIVCSKD